MAWDTEKHDLRFTTNKEIRIIIVKPNIKDVVFDLRLRLLILEQGWKEGRAGLCFLTDSPVHFKSWELQLYHCELLLDCVKMEGTSCPNGMKDATKDNERTRLVQTSKTCGQTLVALSLPGGEGWRSTIFSWTRSILSKRFLWYHGIRYRVGLSGRVLNWLSANHVGSFSFIRTKTFWNREWHELL